MKTFKQFLREEEEKHPLRKLVEEKCGPFLAESRHKGFLYRGLTPASLTAAPEVIKDERFPDGELRYWIKQVRKDRKPKDTKSEVHTMVDDWFEEKFGIRARSQTAFCFGEEGSGDTGLYGKPHVFLPIGEFKFYWSPTVRDLYNLVKNLDSPTKEEVYQLLDKQRYTDANLPIAVMHENEVMVDCDQYIVFATEINSDHLYLVHQILGVQMHWFDDDRHRG